MSVQARFSGVCPDCGERWQPGDLIRAADQPTWPTVWTHAACPDPLVDRLIGKPCPVCWLIHPEGACDR